MTTWWHRFKALLQAPRPAVSAGAIWPAAATPHQRQRKRHGTTTATVATSAVPTAPTPPREPALSEAAAIELTFLSWLLALPSDAGAPVPAYETQILRRLARRVADTGGHDSLLPRATVVVPRLLARLRSASCSTTELAQCVTRDLSLVAEVIGMANSAYYRRATAIVDVEQAIRVLGSDGLRSAIARTLLKPLFEPRGSDLLARSTARLWQHTEHKAQLCAALASSEGADPFEGYLQGLAHNAAWSVVLRVLDRAQDPRPGHPSPSFVVALDTQRDRLFGIIARQWQLTPTLAQVGADVARHGLAATDTPSARRLYRADRLASLLCDPDAARRAALAAPLLATLAASVRDGYEMLQASATTTA